MSGILPSYKKLNLVWKITTQAVVTRFGAEKQCDKKFYIEGCNKKFIYSFQACTA